MFAVLQRDEAGFLLDRMHAGAQAAEWISGAPERTWTGGVKTNTRFSPVEPCDARAAATWNRTPPKTRMNQITE
jgi:uncharacterized cupin superfamily protein